VDLNFSADFNDLERALSDVMQRQLPFAMMLSLNDAAMDVKAVEERTLEKTFDRPTPFTKRAVYVRRARKTDLTSEIGIKKVQAGYLKLQAEGGVRKPKRSALVIGAALKRNKYGNLPRNAVRSAEAKGDTFVANGQGKTKHLAPGLYRRPKYGKYRKGGRGSKNIGTQKGPAMLVSFKPRAQYKRRFEFQPVAAKEARSTFQGHLVRRLLEAQRTAR
jgi:hypothetical protein